MSRVLYVDDNPKNLIEFKRALGHSGVEVDVACDLSTGLIRLSDRSYDFVFVDEDLASHRMTGELFGAEYLEQRARILNPNVVAVEFISGPQYNRKVSPNFILMKPMCYRANEISNIINGAINGAK